MSNPGQGPGSGLSKDRSGDRRAPKRSPDDCDGVAGGRGCHGDRKCHLSALHSSRADASAAPLEPRRHNVCHVRHILPASAPSQRLPASILSRCPAPNAQTGFAETAPNAYIGQRRTAPMRLKTPHKLCKAAEASSVNLRRSITRLIPAFSGPR